ncbi:twin-arginine translocation signal domain-containing protein, partial [Sphingobium yanoikuyae]|uniref:twin-arginine translocation signal domain-containing protein n=1 Tax=Sphingobium yanoikuyae TaxID=13690 RepID=UPI0028AB7385
MNRRQFLTTSGATALAASAPRAFAQPGSQDARLRAMLDGFFYERLDDSPEQATRLGLDTGARAPLKARLGD